mmetsp:Transcript_15477/g.50685  ORF Transcript_15477/g.50685 Transcript_15477/m.50685 type:complete len:164 (-) Transcript_15477:60-551(-)
MGSLLGTRRTSRKPEILQDRDRIHSPSFKPTLNATATFIRNNFEAIINEGRSSSTGNVFEEKAAVGFSWIPNFVKQYDTRLKNNKWPGDDAARKVEAATSRAEVEQIRAELTFERVEEMNGITMRQYLDRIKYRGRSKLRLKDGTLKEAMHKAFGLEPAAAAA